MKLARREFYNVTRSDEWRLYPIGDVHLGNAACDEKALRQTVQAIADDDHALWVGMGDFCLSEDTEVLTNRGWVGIDDVSPDDYAVVYEQDTGEGRFEPILRKWINPTHGSLVHLRSSHVDALVTHEHRVVVNHHVGGKWKPAEVVRAKRLLKGKTKHVWRLPVAATSWRGIDCGLSPDWFALKGWIDTEGSLERVGNYERLQIAQSATANKQYVKNIDALLGRLGLHPHRSKRKWGVVVWRFPGKETRYIHNLIGRKGERVDKMMNAPREHLLAYFNALMDGDGCWCRYTFAQKERMLVDIFQELCFKLGMRARVERSTSGICDMWACYFGTGRGTHSLLREVTEAPYEGMTWCITTPTGTIVTRRNGKIVVLGNCDFINMSDPRFNADSLARWVKVSHLADLAKAQVTRFLDIIEPIAGKCLALIEGNHERQIHRHTERAVYSEIVTGVKGRGNFAPDHVLGLGYSGWLMLHFYRSEQKRHATTLRLWLHHGYAGGRKPGGKANAMVDTMLTHDADLVIMGHCHDDMALPVSVETVRGGQVVKDVRKGCYGGTFLGSAGYAEEKGYPPQPVMQPVILLRPGQEAQKDRIRVMV